MHLKPEEVAQRLRTSVGTLSNWRMQGRGPKYIKLGRKILYPLREVEAFETSHTVANTAMQIPVR